MKATLSIATSERWTDKEGEKVEKTEWHRCIVWGRKAEVIGEYFRKGDGIIVEGKLQTRNWEDNDGNTRYVTEVNVFNFHFLPGKRSGGGASNPSASSAGGQQDSDIPF